MNSTDYVKGELAKCLDTLAATSPKEENYTRVLGALNNVVNLSGVIFEAIAMVESEDAEPVGKVVPFPAEPTAFEEPEVFTEEPVNNPPTEEELKEIDAMNEEPKAEPAAEAKTYTQAEVRQALIDARMKHNFDSSAYLRSFGVTSLSAIPSTKYAELMAGLEEKLK